MREAATYSWPQRAGLALLRAGAVPRHVAFIMDGNRRFARGRGQATIEGHKGGFHKLADCLQWCRELGVREVTVYAFSIENFKREESEVAAILQLATEKFEELVGEAEKLSRHGVKVRVLGDTALLPPALRAATARAEAATATNSQCTLNVALAYTARQELARAVQRAAEAVQAGELRAEEISESVVQGLLYTGSSPPVDLLIRTSGETRLSDFMLWQAADSVLHFTSVMWPAFTLWHLLAAVFYYQRHRAGLAALLEEREEEERPEVEVLDLDTGVAALLGGLGRKAE